MSNDTLTPLREVVRKFNKHVLNPAMMHLAGRRYWYASVIRHTGRASGKQYATPVVAEQVAGGFLVPLPYGTRVDWLRNVLASGQATIVTKGQTHQVAVPKIIDLAEASAQLTPSRRRAFERFRIEKFLKLVSVQRVSGDHNDH